MEFVERDEEHNEEPERLLDFARNDGERLLDYAPDELLDSTERLWDAHEARCYKYAAQSAMTKMCHNSQGEFNDTFERYMKNSRRLREIREGTAEPEPFRLDYGKVAYTGATQVANITLAGLCITLGAWPMALLTIPTLLALNYHWLTKDQKNG
jgi:hypothetical protein